MKKRFLTILLSAFYLSSAASAGEISAAFFDGESVIHGQLEDHPDQSSFLSELGVLRLWSHSENSAEVYRKVQSITKRSFTGFAAAEITSAESGETQKVYFYSGDDSELYALLEDGFVIRWEMP